MSVYGKPPFSIIAISLAIAFTLFSFQVEANKRKAPISKSAKLASKGKRKIDRDVGQQRLLIGKADKILKEMKSRPLRSASATRKIHLSAEPSKSSWLKAIYDKNIVESSWATKMLADKRIFAAVLERELGDKAWNFFPRTIGLKEFLKKHSFIDKRGRISASGDAIDAALYREFPAGFVVRPAVGVGPQESGRGLFPDSDWFIVELIKPGSSLYDAKQIRKPFLNPVIGEVASGEQFVLQENIITSMDARKKLKARFFHEVRIHTYEDRVVADAVPERWVQTDLLTPVQVAGAERFVAEFLKSLSIHFLNRQAFGVDVAVFDNGEMRIIDVVTNRGKQIQWSGYLDQPKVIAAYSKHFEGVGGFEFTGWKGVVIREGFANYLPYWKMRVEKSRDGWDKVLSYLPPVP